MNSHKRVIAVEDSVTNTLQKTKGKNIIYIFMCMILLNMSLLSDEIIPVRDKEAARFLTQATFGPTMDAIKELQSMGTRKNKVAYRNWLDAEFDKPITLLAPKLLASKEEGPYYQTDMDYVWRDSIIKGEDQLRQRMSFALSQIFVTGFISGLSSYTYARENYYDTLARNAFGNYSTLLKEVTLNPIMGRYLSMLNNRKADTRRKTHPDENYAREVMQLFSLGLVHLNNDGSAKLDVNGKEIPTYTQDDISNLARVFTGWELVLVQENQIDGLSNNYIDAMKCNDDYHDFDEKLLLGKNIPSGLSCEKDLDAALKIIFEHKNVPMFISKQLIQRFVTSNPTPRYVQSISRAFKRNENNVRGDLRYVISKILLHPEARKYRSADENTFGKIKEPTIRWASYMRATKAVNKKYDTFSFYELNDDLYQGHLKSPSVFNFYRPDHEIETTEGNRLYSPEMQIMTSITIPRTSNFYYDFSFKVSCTPGVKCLDIEEHIQDLQTNPKSFIDTFNLLLFSGQLDRESQKIIKEAMLNSESLEGAEHYPDPLVNLNNKTIFARMQLYANRYRAGVGLFLMMNHPQQSLQK